MFIEAAIKGTKRNPVSGLAKLVSADGPMTAFQKQASHMLGCWPILGERSEQSGVIGSSMSAMPCYRQLKTEQRFFEGPTTWLLSVDRLNKRTIRC